MYKIRVKKLNGEYVLSVVSKDLRYVQTKTGYRYNRYRDTDELNMDSAELVHYITEAVRMLEGVYNG